MPLIYSFFSVWGLIQLILCGLSWVVLVRYRSLTPLIILSFLIEWSARVFNAGTVINNPEYSNGITPGVAYAPYMTLFLLLLFLASLVKKSAQN
jgi:hypothetical protein